jgi:hypothetical protein
LGVAAKGIVEEAPPLKELQKNAEDYLFYGTDLNRTIELIEKP